MADTDKLIKLLETLKQDFEMLQDGRWDLNYSDGSEIVASLDNVEEAITIAKSINSSSKNKTFQYVATEGWTTNIT